MKRIRCNFVACFCLVFLALFWLRSCWVLFWPSQVTRLLGLSVGGDAHSSLPACLCVTLQIPRFLAWVIPTLTPATKPSSPAVLEVDRTGWPSLGRLSDGRLIVDFIGIGTRGLGAVRLVCPRLLSAYLGLFPLTQYYSFYQPNMPFISVITPAARI